VNLAGLVVRDLMRNPLRLALTVLAATIGVLAFIFLQTVIDLWYAGVAQSKPDRLAVRNKISITQNLPLSYLQRIQAIPGVSAVTFGGWFGGRRSERARDFFPTFFVEPSTYLKIFDEYVAPSEQIAAWAADPCGAMVGEVLGERYGWKVGDRVTLQGDIYPGTWTFTVRGIYRGKDPRADTTGLAFGYRCLNEKLPADRKDQVGFFSVRVDDPARSIEVAANIDGMFANSAYQTKTESERTFQLGFVAMSSAILTAVRIVAYVILAIMLLVVGNTLAMGVREKTVDLATLRALGFQRRHIAGLVLSESAVIGVLSAALGTMAAPPMISGFIEQVSKVFGPMPKVAVTPLTFALGAGASIVVGLAAGLLPAIKAARLPVAEGLRRIA
jgi:putative ABC transport system permease protein